MRGRDHLQPHRLGTGAINSLVRNFERLANTKSRAAEKLIYFVEDRIIRDSSQVVKKKGADTGDCPYNDFFVAYWILDVNRYWPDCVSTTARPSSIRINFTPAASASGFPLS